MKFTRALRILAVRLKVATAMLFSGSVPWGQWWDGWRGGFNYKANVDSSTSSLIMACVLWIARTFPEAPLTVSRALADGTEEPLPAHPMLQLIERPNPYYSGVALWMATMVDYQTTGNAYWLKIRSRAGRPAQLWWIPQWLMRPIWPADGSAFLTGYEYTPGGQRIVYDPSDVVHFRYGLDPTNYRLGRAPLDSLWREIFTDEEAANFSASLLRNLGVPGVIISPGSDTAVFTPESALAVKQQFQARFGGDRRGEPLVLDGKATVQVLSFSPEQLDLKNLRKVPEERVAAVLGIPPMVVGFGAGLERSTFSNYQQAKEAAYENNLIPTQRLIAADLEVQLLPDFGASTGLNVGHDYAKVRALAEDETAKVEREVRKLTSGGQTLAEFRRAFGLDADASHDVFYVPTTVTVTPYDEIIPPPPEPQPAALAAANAAAGALPPGTALTPDTPATNGRAAAG